MDKVIIFGTYGFVGYSTCVKLLEEGYEVNGYHLDIGELQDIIENKKLMIGRNANFQERSFGEDTHILEEDRETTIIISYYDFFHTLDEKRFVSHPFMKLDMALTCRHPDKLKFVCLYPYEFLNGVPFLIQEQINWLKKFNRPLQTIYLPTVYGPWQPETFLFQQYYLKEETDKMVFDKRECMMDAIYIDDLTDKLVSLLNINESSKIILQSEEGNKWLKCAEYLNLQSFYQNRQKEDLQIHEDCQIIKVKGNIPLSEALKHQKNQAEIIKKLL
ncbi:hypothetical protein [Neobacillus sp. D3-1R]|uniref:hypothetical protein n=1 Tax=Neobacillus sp. D3-1R TaxID=3445778 RepID=UPI003F9EC00B